MAQLVLAAVAFLVTHFVASTPLRAKITGAIGERAYRALYSVVAIVTLGWMIWAFRAAPRELLWGGARWLPAAVMPFAFMLLATGYRLNPTMVGAERLLKNDDPARGTIRITRHPMLWAIMLWSAAHLLARGDLASLVFFGTFLIVAALGTVSIDARKQANPDWPRFAAVTSNIPLVALAQG